MGSLQNELMSRETIKPLSPTPPQLQNYKLSLLDQISARNYVPRVFFYSNSNSNIAGAHHLKASLSQTLTQYYPFAGRLRDEGQVSIDCTDDGVDFLEARIHCSLYHFLTKPNLNLKTLHLLFPDGLLGNYTYKGSLVVIQTSLFTCGAVAVAVCMSHKLGDGCTLVAFLNHWASIARLHVSDNYKKLLPPPYFISLAYPPPVSDRLAMTRPAELVMKNCVTRRFVFDGVKIAELKAMARGPGVENPTRVEVVTAILYKCAMAASSVANSDSPTPSVLSQVVNMRPKMEPPLPETSAGNFCWHFTVSTSEEDQREMSVQGLVAELRKSKDEFLDQHAKSVSVSEWLVAIGRLMEAARKLYGSSGNLNVYICSSMCNYPFYEVDFGWGKPMWLGIAGNIFKNTFCLVDLPSGDGIEAWVTLSEQDMAFFELDRDLLAFASFNPSPS